MTQKIKIMVLLTVVLYSVNKVRAQTKADSLAGSWIPVSQAIAGKALPKSVFSKEKLTIMDSIYTVVAESVDKGVVKYTGNKMDIYGKQGVNAGKHFTALYKLENGQLTVCYNLKGDSYPDTFDTTGKPAFFISVFQRERK